MKAESKATRAVGTTIARILITVAATVALAIATVAFADAAGPSGTLRASQSMGGATKRVVKKAHNRKLGRTILVNLKGHTLYSLSAEKQGRFICTNSTCLSVWHPLTVPSGTTPTGPVKLRDPDAARRSHAGAVPRPAALHLCPRQEAGAGRRRGIQGRRHLARGAGTEAHPVGAGPGPDSTV